jgi:hypothetical protein
LGIPKRDQSNLRGYEEPSNSYKEKDKADIAKDMNGHRLKGNFFTRKRFTNYLFGIAKAVAGA